jgi:FkbM family methyltransferase
MKIGKRSLKQFIKALFSKQHYTALFGVFLICQHPIDFLKQYFWGVGTYPTKITLRTPLGKVEPKVYSYYDTLTINEIFFRIDYKARKNIRVVIDIGSNIGISALYFLTRNKYCKCYLFEPDPDNIKKLNENLLNFKDRYELRECAVANETGTKKFGRDPMGRCGGLSRKTGDYIYVRLCHINDALRDILKTNDTIDILKIDVEGEEFEILQAIEQKLLDKIKIIYLEIDHTVNLSPNFSFHPRLFSQRRRGETYMLFNKKI